MLRRATTRRRIFARLELVTPAAPVELTKSVEFVEVVEFVEPVEPVTPGSSVPAYLSARRLMRPVHT
jgi:hypothetical protein